MTTRTSNATQPMGCLGGIIGALLLLISIFSYSDGKEILSIFTGVPGLFFLTYWIGTNMKN